MKKKAKYYQLKEGNTVQCLLCPHCCVIEDGQYGSCRIRKNIEGVLYSLIYGKIAALHIDPIEKKPLYHYHCGSQILSIGSYGCNFHCSFCQNYDISQTGVENKPFKELRPKDLLELVKENKSFGVAYTYNEPLINFEYVYDCSVLMQKHNIKNVFVTNGYINSEPLNELVPFIDAANIDIKSFNNDFYKEKCIGGLEAVKNTIKTMHKNGVFIELTNLVIPTLNDDFKEIEELVKWIASIDKNIPLHFSRYFPCYKLNIEPTPKETLIKAVNIAKQYLTNVYLGNI